MTIKKNRIRLNLKYIEKINSTLEYNDVKNSYKKNRMLKN